MFISKSLFKKITSILVFSLFFSTLTPIAQASFWQQRQKAQISPTSLNTLNSANICALTQDQKSVIQQPKLIAPAFGQVVDSYYPALVDTQNPIIIIQDAHHHIGAQQNLMEILLHLRAQRTNKQPVHIYVEGAAKRVNPFWITAYPDKNFGLYLGLKTLQQNIVMGEELAAAKFPQDFIVQGIEDSFVYAANGKARAQVQPYRKHIQQKLLLWKQLLDIKKKTVYSQHLRSFQAEKEKFYNDEISLKNYLCNLDKTYGHALASANIITFLQLANQEDTTAQTSVVWQKSIKDLTPFLSATEKIMLTQKSLALRLNQVQPRLFNAVLLQLACQHKTNIVDLQKIDATLSLSEKINAEQLLQDVELWQYHLQQKILSTVKNYKDCLKLIELENLWQQEQKFWNEAFAPQDWQRYQRRLWTKNLFAKSKADSGLLQLQQTLENSNQEIIFNSSLGKKTESQLRFYQQAYYQLAQNRDMVLSNNLKKYLKLKDSSTRVIIAGGFHTPGITAQLRAQNKAYIVARPNLQAEKVNQLSYTANKNWQSLKQSYTENLNTLFKQAKINKDFNLAYLLQKSILNIDAVDQKIERSIHNNHTILACVINNPTHKQYIALHFNRLAKSAIAQAGQMYRPQPSAVNTLMPCVAIQASQYLEENPGFDWTKTESLSQEEYENLLQKSQEPSAFKSLVVHPIVEGIALAVGFFCIFLLYKLPAFLGLDLPMFSKNLQHILIGATALLVLPVLFAYFHSRQRMLLWVAGMLFTLPFTIFFYCGLPLWIVTSGGLASSILLHQIWNSLARKGLLPYAVLNLSWWNSESTAKDIRINIVFFMIKNHDDRRQILDHFVRFRDFEGRSADDIELAQVFKYFSDYINEATVSKKTKTMIYEINMAMLISDESFEVETAAIEKLYRDGKNKSAEKRLSGFVGDMSNIEQLSSMRRDRLRALQQAITQGSVEPLAPHHLQPDTTLPVDLQEASESELSAPHTTHSLQPAMPSAPSAVLDLTQVNFETPIKIFTSGVLNLRTIHNPYQRHQILDHLVKICSLSRRDHVAIEGRKVDDPELNLAFEYLIQHIENTPHKKVKTMLEDINMAMLVSDESFETVTTFLKHHHKLVSNRILKQFVGNNLSNIDKLSPMRRDRLHALKQDITIKERSTSSVTHPLQHRQELSTLLDFSGSELARFQTMPQPMDAQDADPQESDDDDLYMVEHFYNEPATQSGFKKDYDEVDSDATETDDELYLQSFAFGANDYDEEVDLEVVFASIHWQYLDFDARLKIFENVLYRITTRQQLKTLIQYSGQYLLAAPYNEIMLYGPSLNAAELRRYYHDIVVEVNAYLAEDDQPQIPTDSHSFWGQYLKSFVYGPVVQAAFAQAEEAQPLKRKRKKEYSKESSVTQTPKKRKEKKAASSSTSSPSTSLQDLSPLMSPPSSSRRRSSASLLSLQDRQSLVGRLGENFVLPPVQVLHAQELTQTIASINALIASISDIASAVKALNNIYTFWGGSFYGKPRTAERINYAVLVEKVNPYLSESHKIGAYSIGALDSLLEAAYSDLKAKLPVEPQRQNVVEVDGELPPTPKAKPTKKRSLQFNPPERPTVVVEEPLESEEDEVQIPSSRPVLDLTLVDTVDSEYTDDNPEGLIDVLRETFPSAPVNSMTSVQLNLVLDEIGTLIENINSRPRAIIALNNIRKLFGETFYNPLIRSRKLPYIYRALIEKIDPLLDDEFKIGSFSPFTINENLELAYVSLSSYSDVTSADASYASLLAPIWQALRLPLGIQKFLNAVSALAETSAVFFLSQSGLFMAGIGGFSFFLSIFVATHLLVQLLVTLLNKNYRQQAAPTLLFSFMFFTVAGAIISLPLLLEFKSDIFWITLAITGFAHTLWNLSRNMHPHDVINDQIKKALKTQVHVKTLIILDFRELTPQQQKLYQALMQQMDKDTTTFWVVGEVSGLNPSIPVLPNMEEVKTKLSKEIFTEKLLLSDKKTQEDGLTDLGVRWISTAAILNSLVSGQAITFSAQQVNQLVSLGLLSSLPGQATEKGGWTLPEQKWYSSSSQFQNAFLALKVTLISQ